MVQRREKEGHRNTFHSISNEFQLESRREEGKVDVGTMRSILYISGDKYRT